MKNQELVRCVLLFFIDSHSLYTTHALGSRFTQKRRKQRNQHKQNQEERENKINENEGKKNE